MQQVESHITLGNDTFVKSAGVIGISEGKPTLHIQNNA